MYVISYTFFLYPARPSPEAVGNGEEQEGEHIPQEDDEYLLWNGVLGQAPEGVLFQRLELQMFLDDGQTVVAPLADDLAVLQQQQSWIAADNGAQHGLVGLTEGIFAPRDVFPPMNALPATGCQTAPDGAIPAGRCSLDC